MGVNNPGTQLDGCVCVGVCACMCESSSDKTRFLFNL